MVSSNEKMLACAIYLSSFLTAFLAPLIIWLLKKDESQFVDVHGREYLNFFISYSIYSFCAWILMFVLIGFLILPIIGLAVLIFTIMGAIKAFEGEIYRIPLTIRFLK